MSVYPLAPASVSASALNFPDSSSPGCVLLRNHRLASPVAPAPTNNRTVSASPRPRRVLQARPRHAVRLVRVRAELQQHRHRQRRAPPARAHERLVQGAQERGVPGLCRTVALEQRPQRGGLVALRREVDGPGQLARDFSLGAGSPFGGSCR
ncbi:hypothetical protein PG997_002583 [Apiospora hydei]|uniref:Uncharacterized protein n=1 Tax=Apiospora hydei TaxID=1337664 RepID=A0ABR1WWS9_9PEZI